MNSSMIQARFGDKNIASKWHLLFYCNRLSGFLIPGKDNGTIGSVTELLYVLVAMHSLWQSGSQSQYGNKSTRTAADNGVTAIALVLFFSVSAMHWSWGPRIACTNSPWNPQSYEIGDQAIKTTNSPSGKHGSHRFDDHDENSPSRCFDQYHPTWKIDSNNSQPL